MKGDVMTKELITLIVDTVMSVTLTLVGAFVVPDYAKLINSLVLTVQPLVLALAVYWFVERKAQEFAAFIEHTVESTVARWFRDKP